MLILTRRAGQKIRITGPATITLWPKGGGRVKVAIQAADDVQIVRSELEENKPDGKAQQPDHAEL